MHTCFVRPFWVRYRRSGEIVLQTGSSNTYHLSRSRRHRQFRIPLGKHHGSRILPYSWVRATNVQYVNLMVGRDNQIIEFLCQGYLGAYVTSSNHPITQARVASDPSHAHAHAPFSHTISSTPARARFTQTCCISAIPSATPPGRSSPRLCEDSSSTLTGTASRSHCA